MQLLVTHLNSVLQGRGGIWFFCMDHCSAKLLKNETLVTYVVYGKKKKCLNCKKKSFKFKQKKGLSRDKNYTSQISIGQPLTGISSALVYISPKLSQQISIPDFM